MKANLDSACLKGKLWVWSLWFDSSHCSLERSYLPQQLSHAHRIRSHLPPLHLKFCRSNSFAHWCNFLDLIMPNGIPAERQRRQQSGYEYMSSQSHPSTPLEKAQFLVKNLLGLSLLSGGTTLSETVLESSVDVLEVSHSAGTAKNTTC